MFDAHFGRATIRTLAYSMLSEVVAQVSARAGLAVVRGPVGIGKSFALAQITADLEAQGDRVVSITSTPEVEGSIGAFTRAVLAQYGIQGGTTSTAVERLGDLLLSGHPFQPGGQRIVFVVDEAQGLKVNILETIRGLWDEGDRARQGESWQPAFGCVLVGNDSFFNKGGHARKAEFRPLMSRVTHDVDLPRTDRAECECFARAILPGDEEARSYLVGFGETAGNLRAMDKAVRQARIIAGGDHFTVADLRRAVRFMGGR